MRSFAYLLLLVATTATTANPIESSQEDVSLAARGELFARKLCIVENGIACYYDGGGCYFHKCKDCSCDASYGGKTLVRRNCTDHSDCTVKN
ncbi:hypothetical protein Cob_v011179 [Colletotrichum orbiculare MAFF 240422]|uniref:Uncharacterized protein n=1 Tax=Colletotrichum orbiculare (strain 104-T / ATCC 96160 / CBS 514.97 / LARS 414 / MAFF 240422) TaxID=1213857 RepID=N4UVJ7_COLOR|nr:hypothetical protein Cob_v011179 [Colletotrichum orbiculare MAFF 240422]